MTAATIPSACAERGPSRCTGTGTGTSCRPGTAPGTGQIGVSIPGDDPTIRIISAPVPGRPGPDGNEVVRSHALGRFAKHEVQAIWLGPHILRKSPRAEGTRQKAGWQALTVG